MLRHLRRQQAQKRVRVRHLRSPVKRVGCSPVILKIHVIDEAQIVIELPVVGIVLDAVLHQPNRVLGLSCAARWRRSEKAGSELISHNQFRIEMRGDVEQRKKQVIASRAVVVPSAKILHGARPIDIGKQAVVAQTGALQHLGRIEIQHVFERGLWAKFVGAMKYYGTGRQKNGNARPGNDRNFAALLHFRFRCSKMSTAPLRAIAA